MFQDMNKICLISKIFISAYHFFVLKILSYLLLVYLIFDTPLSLPCLKNSSASHYYSDNLFFSECSCIFEILLITTKENVKTDVVFELVHTERLLHIFWEFLVTEEICSYTLFAVGVVHVHNFDQSNLWSYKAHSMVHFLKLVMWKYEIKSTVFIDIIIYYQSRSVVDMCGLMSHVANFNATACDV